MITRLAVTPAKMAEENNKIQEIAARGRLGIPMTISTDPRHHFQVVSGATTAGMGYSQWPESLGFGALVEHVFAHEKHQMGLFIRTIGIMRAEAKITLANLAYNMKRLIFHERRAMAG